jgi:translation initiation factor IF-3
MKFRPSIGRGDFETKARKVDQWVAAGERVRVTIMFRGREVQHPELGRRILDRLRERFPDAYMTEPTMKGRDMTATIQPKRPNPPGGVREPRRPKPDPGSGHLVESEARPTA